MGGFIAEYSSFINYFNFIRFGKNWTSKLSDCDCRNVEILYNMKNMAY